MRDVRDELLGWWRAGTPAGMATVVATWRSAPRPAGAVMLVGADGTAGGSVSGGCVEGAVYDLAKEVADSGRPVWQRYGVSDEDAFTVGLTCGGIIDVYVERVDRTSFPELGAVAAAIGLPSLRGWGRGGGGAPRPPPGGGGHRRRDGGRRGGRDRRRGLPRSGAAAR